MIQINITAVEGFNWDLLVVDGYLLNFCGVELPLIL